MVDRLPDDNFGPESKPWAREISTRILSLQAAMDLTNQGIGLSFNGINGTLNALQQQIGQVAAAAASAQAAANAAAAAAAGQVVPATGSSIATNFTLPTSDTIVTAVAFTVPSGYTRAVVTAMGSIVAASSSSGDRLYAKCGINGNVGSEMGTVTTTATPWANISCFASLVMSGLTPGGSFNVDIRARLNTGPGSNLVDYAQVAATVLYLK